MNNINFIGGDWTLEYVNDNGGNIDFIATPPILYQPEENEKEMPKLLETEINNEGQLNSAVIQSLKAVVEGKHDFKGTWLRYTRTVEVDDLKGSIDHGMFRVVNQEYSVDEDTTTFTMFDQMIKTQKEVHPDEFNLKFPTTLYKLFIKVAEICEIETDVKSFKNGDTIVQRDEWTNTINTYRNILNHIAEITGMVVGIKEDKLDIWGYEDTGIIINENRTKTLDVGEKVGSFNILNVTQEPQHDNRPYPPNWIEIPVDERSEYVLANNPIAIYDRELYSPIIFNNIKDLEYTTFEADTFGWGIFHIGDVVTVKDLDGNEHKSIITHENGEFKQAFHSIVGSKKINNAKDEYVIATDQRREGQKVSLLVDQQEGKIQGLIETTQETEDKVTDLTLDVDGLKSQVGSINTNSNLILNLSGTMDGYQFWNFENTPLLKYFEGLVYKEGLQYGSNFEVVPVTNSLSRYGLSFLANGKAVSAYAFIVPDTIYSFRAKRVSGEHAFQVDVREYDKDYKLIKTTPFALSGKAYEAFSIQPISNTVYIKLAFEVPTATYENRLVLSDMMFNRGNPKEWQENAEEVKAWAKSELIQLDNQITSTVEEIKIVDGKTEQNKSVIEQQSSQIQLVTNKTDGIENKIDNTTVKITPEEGVEIWATNGKGLTIRDKNNKETITLNTDGSLKMVGDLSAGTVGGMSIQNGMLTREHRVTTKKYTESDLTRIQQIIMDNIVPNDQDYINYDIDGNGRIDSVDLMLIRGMIDKGNNPTTIIYKMFIGGNDGGIKTTKEVVGVGTYSVEMVGSMIKSSGLQAKTLSNPDNKNVRINLYDQDTIDMSVGKRYIHLNNDGLSTQNIDAFHIKGLSYTLGNNRVIEPATDSSNQARANIYQMNPRAGHGGTIGLATNRYSTIYLRNQPNVSSDLRYKRLVSRINDDLLDVVKEIKPRTYYTIYDDKIHFGYIAQDVERALYKYALKTYDRQKALEVLDDFAMLSKDESYMSLLYGEIQVLKDAYYQRELDRQEELNKNVLSRLEQLQSELKDLQEQFKGQGKEIEN